MPRFKEGERILIDATVLSVQGGKLKVFTRSKHEAFLIQRADARKFTHLGDGDSPEVADAYGWIMCGHTPEDGGET